MVFFSWVMIDEIERLMPARLDAPAQCTANLKRTHNERFGLSGESPRWVVYLLEDNSTNHVGKFSDGMVLT